MKLRLLFEKTASSALLFATFGWFATGLASVQAAPEVNTERVWSKPVGGDKGTRAMGVGTRGQGDKVIKGEFLLISPFPPNPQRGPRVPPIPKGDPESPHLPIPNSLPTTYDQTHTETAKATVETPTQEQLDSTVATAPAANPTIANSDVSSDSSVESKSDEIIPASEIVETLLAEDFSTQVSPDLTSHSPTFQEDNTDDPMAQVTNVSQLSDVQPTDWAYTALRSLVERYGSIAGYPDGTFRGNRALTRYEFAAGLNAALDRIKSLVAGTTADLVTKEDLAAVRRLQEEFAAELATLQERVDTLETRTAQLEAHQFSTTTKLSGLISFNIVGATADGSVKRETGSRVGGVPAVEVVKRKPNVTFSYQSVLGLNTSFTGKDSLLLQLTASNSKSPVPTVYGSAGINTLGLPFTDFLPGTQPNTPTIFQLYYSFPATDTVQVLVGPRINWQFIFDINNFTNPFTGGAGGFNVLSSPTLLTTPRGAGVVAIWKLSDQFTLSSAYLAESNEFLPTNAAPDPRRGLFGKNRTNSLTAMLTYSPIPTANIRLTYLRGHQGTSPVGQIFERPIVGLADDGLGGPLRGGSSNAFSLSADWLVSKGFGVFGRYSYSSIHLNPATPGVPGGNVSAQTYELGVAFPDLGRKGARATLTYTVPYSVTEGRRFLVSTGGNGATQSEFEATYFLPLSNNVAVIPSFYIIWKPNNFSDNPTIYLGQLRTQFAF